MNQYRWIRVAAVLGMTAVILGAFGAHALKSRLTPDLLASYETGIDYHFVHTLALLLIVLISYRIDSPWVVRSAWSFLIGILLFSGSIYLLSTRSLLGVDSLSFLGPVTPIGGLAFIFGWMFLLIGAASKRQN